MKWEYAAFDIAVWVEKGKQTVVSVNGVDKNPRCTLDEFLNRLGAAQWELAEIQSGGTLGVGRYIFKRPVKSAEPQA
jgi:hypothetical protein